MGTSVLSHKNVHCPESSAHAGWALIADGVCTSPAVCAEAKGPGGEAPPPQLQLGRYDF